MKIQLIYLTLLHIHTSKDFFTENSYPKDYVFDVTYIGVGKKQGKLFYPRFRMDDGRFFIIGSNGFNVLETCANYEKDLREHLTN